MIHTRPAPHPPLCPWCSCPDIKPKTFRNGSPTARRQVRKGRAKIVNIAIPYRLKPISITRTVCAHICHGF